MQVLMRESYELERPGAARQGSCNPTMPQLTEALRLAGTKVGTIRCFA